VGSRVVVAPAALVQRWFVGSPDDRSGDMSETIDLDGKRALVTGAGSGIGRGIALRLASAGADVIVNDLDPATALHTADDIRYLGRRSATAIADLARSAEVDAMCDAAEAAFGGVDILVNNAGISLYRSIVDCSEEDWDRHLDIMAKATFLTMRRLAPPMMQRGWGRIVNLGSYLAQVNCAAKFFGPYCAAKFAVIGLTQVAAQEFAPQVTVNAVGPGDVDTDMMAREWDLEGERRGIPAAEVKEEYRRRLILGRLERPDDIAAAVLFLVSPAGDQVTGSHLIVSGGLPFHH
jgi:NAD(P)-dependent dehydrogenase (short-subunit alcohol dehydrogenase family)